MKIRFSVLILSVILISLAYSCKEEIYNEKINSNGETKTRSNCEYGEVYCYHYNGLLFASNYYPMNSVSRVCEVVNLFNSTQANFINNEIDCELLETISNNTQITPLFEVVDNYIESVNNIAWFSLEKRTKLDELISITKVLQIIPSNRSLIISKINGESDIEIKNGYNLLLSSYDYWTGDQSNDNDDVPKIQIDLAGYIVGWLVAVAEDYASGDLCPENQGSRIKRAAQTGFGCSTGHFLFKRH